MPSVEPLSLKAECNGEKSKVTEVAALPEKSEVAEVAALPKKIGMACDTKSLYAKEDEQGRTTWTITYPDDLEEAAENDETALFAILVRKKKSFDPRKKLEIDSIVVQSPLLKTALSTVLKGYPGNYNPFI